MMPVLMALQVFVCIALIGIVLIQRSEGGGLGIGSSQGMGAFMSGRGTANLLTRTTAILTACFFGTSIALAIIAAHSRAPVSVIDQPSTTQPAPAAPAAPTVPATPTVPAAPTAPLAK